MRLQLSWIVSAIPAFIDNKRSADAGSRHFFGFYGQGQQKITNA